MPIVFAAPAAAAVSRGADLDLPRAMRWTGADGSVWHLTRPRAVNPRMRPGVKGLHMPRMEVHQTSTPLVHGVDLVGYTIPGRDVYWPLLFRAASAADWEAAHGAFFDSFHPVIPGTWTVGEGDSARTLGLTGEFEGDHSFTHDPFVTGSAIIGIKLFAPRPLWRGKEIRLVFESGAGQPFIGSEKAPPFYISPTATYQNAEIRNPGNEPSYLRWTVFGPEPHAVLGVGPSIIDVPFAIDEGSSLVIDTDPAAQYATLDGVDVTRELGFQMFAPVPPGGATPLHIAGEGDSEVAVELTPLFWRAF
ncbi:MAG: hypothetical protein FJW64_15190 [Actinobacteria bacterium]|nr:hypothetical protein [Actinomycetota bacterium]